MNDSIITTNDEKQATKQTPAQEWLATATVAELTEGAEYLKQDAEYLRKAAAEYSTTPGQEWIAERVMANANHSEELAGAAIAEAKGLAV